VCSTIARGTVAVVGDAAGDRVYVIGPGWSDVHYGFVVLRPVDDRWVVRRELGG